MKFTSQRRAQLPRALTRTTPLAAAAFAALCGGALPQAALAQAQGQAQAAVQSVTVTGIRRGIESAISVKKNSDNIVEAISAEDLGKLPDTSIAESISRLPGVAAQRTVGRASQISIRGFAPDFATTTLNGREQVTTGDSRGVEYDQYPSELVSSVVIHKTPSAGMVGQGLSATVDVQTVRPLDFSGRSVAVNYRRQKSGVGLEQEGKGYRASVSYVDQFADRTIGVALGFARLDETGPRTSKFEAWGVADTCPVAPVNNACPQPTVKTPGGFNDILEQETKTRDGLVAVLEYRPNKNFRTSLDFFQGKFEKKFLKNYFQAPVGFSSAGGYDPEGRLSGATVSNGVATAGSFNNFTAVVRTDSELTKDDLKSLGWKTQAKLGEWTATADLSRSTAKRRGGIVESTAGLPGNAATRDTISWTGFNGTDVGGARYTTGLNYTDRNTIRLTDVMGWGGGTALPQAGYSKLPQVDDKLNAARLSARRDLGDNGWFSGLEFGANQTSREKNRAYIEGRLVIPPSSNPYGTAVIPGSDTANTGRLGIPIATWDPSGLVGSVYQVAPKLVRDIANKDWNVKEKVSTAYGKLDIDSTLLGLPVRGNAGVQVQYTDQSSRAFNVDGAPCPGDVCTTKINSEGKTYTDVLPSLNLSADLGNDQALRFGLGRVLARPNINDMRASLGFGVDTNLGVLKGDAGNPQLNPFRANQIDLSYEKYFGSKAYISAATFYKDLRSFIVKQDVVTDFTPYITSATPLPPNGRVLGLLNRPVNGTGGSVRGLELSASMPLSMATRWLDGFGVQASLSLTSSSVNVPSAGITGDAIQTPNIPLPGLSKRVGNLTFYYEKYGFSARVASRYRSDFVGEVTDIIGDRRLTYVKAERITDLQLSYEFQSGVAKGLSVLFQVNNLNDTPYVRYRDVPSNEIERTKYGKTYLLGVNYKL